MRKYTLSFSLVFFVLNGLSILLAIGSNAVTFGTLLGASLAAGLHFGSDQQRQANKAELKQFSWLSLLATWLISLLMAVVAWFFVLTTAEQELLWADFTKQPIPYWIVVLAATFCSTLAYWTIRFGFSISLKHRFPAINS